MNITHRYNSEARQHYLFKQQYTFKLKPRLLYAGDLKKSYGWSEKTHSHSFCEIIYIMDGRGSITIKDNTYEAKRGDVIIYNSDIPHSEVSSELEPLEIKFMALDHLEITDLPLNHLLPPEYACIYPTGRYAELFATEFEKMISEFETKSTFYIEIAQSIARTLLMYIIRIINEQENDSSFFQNNKNLNLALTYIRENYHHGITLEDIASHCFLNKYYLSHLFTQLQGISIGKYIQNLRINDSMKRLRETTEPVASIAKNVGFNDVGHFCRTFKKETALTPLQYRKQSEILYINK